MHFAYKPVTPTHWERRFKRERRTNSGIINRWARLSCHGPRIPARNFACCLPVYSGVCPPKSAHCRLRAPAPFPARPVPTYPPAYRACYFIATSPCRDGLYVDMWLQLLLSLRRPFWLLYHFYRFLGRNILFLFPTHDTHKNMKVY